MIVPLPRSGDVERALERLKSLHDGDLGVVAITACGKRAIPALRALLIEGVSSGIFEPRCRAVEALAALGAHDVLIEFLEAPREVADPVARTGEEAVMSAAARALIGVEDERILPLLLELAETRTLGGVVEALGSFGRAEALPSLIRGLCEDHTRRAAEGALIAFGGRAREALFAVATRPLPGAEKESPSSRRTRLAALALFCRIGSSAAGLRPLIDDPDPEIAAAACRGLLPAVAEEEKRDVLGRLILLLPRLSLLASREAEETLAEHWKSAREILLSEGAPDPADRSPKARSYRRLLRAARRVGLEAPLC